MKDQIEKQAIEDMAKVIEITEQIARDAHCGLPSPRMYAKDLYWRGYRKQAWISVEDKIPKKRQNCLCYYPEKDYGSKVVVDYAETDDGYFSEQFQYGKPSHWMPLPKPPKMKGATDE